MQGYTKLHQQLITSSVWQEPDNVRLVWITMLALADKNGEVMASIPGLASMARVDMDRCIAAVELLSSPDQYSRTTEFEGRRIEPIRGGWLILNHAYYRHLASRSERQESDALRKRTARARASANVRKPSAMSAGSPHDIRNVRAKSADRPQKNVQAEADIYADPETIGLAAEIFGCATSENFDPPSGDPPIDIGGAHVVGGAQAPYERPSAAEAPRVAKAPKKPRAARVRVSKHPVTDWGGVTDTERELASQLGLDLAAQSAEMADWAMGKGELKADWNAALRGWMRRTAERRAQAPVRMAKAGAQENPFTMARHLERIRELEAQEALEASGQIEPAKGRFW